MKENIGDVIIIGGGMVGLSLANQLLEKKITKSIIIVEKELDIGLHSSGRNSGVLHAGLYYQPGTIKAKVCVEGAKRLRRWVEDRGLPINKCGKVIVPQKEHLDDQLDVLATRGVANGATIEIWDEKQLYSHLPEARTATGRALWSPNTCVVKPILVVQSLESELRKKGVKFIKGQTNWNPIPNEQQVILNDGTKLHYSHLINCSGLQADKVAHKFEVGLNYRLLPFKGLYWEIKEQCSIQPKCNLYPVPDLNVPFLGVHFTPSADLKPKISIGPTATPALGRENYYGLEGIEPWSAIQNLALLSNQYINNRGGFRKYVHEQSFLSIPHFLIKSAQELIPKIEYNHIQISKKVGIRSQLFNQKSHRLEDDFICLSGRNSTHIMNCISPAFTASFALADLILEKIEF
ncbi:NAD(P)/FAD-dependent oxidoreductase [Prochlorococcus sp. MIT 1300]|uniref:NAD(P)/FAD-dependent oxidoreductase n=1 Tax=Prochlorococcus sp. MIT 1300 TaxID=3096218 RepID=UPI002A748D3B|nr:FAD-dependent oxidoreductase [Prochlorococcus sp. MIT 1300]